MKKMNICVEMLRGNLRKIQSDFNLQEKIFKKNLTNELLQKCELKCEDRGQNSSFIRNFFSSFFNSSKLLINVQQFI